MTPPKWLVLVDDYLALRRSLGFDVEKLRWLLRDFARYTERIEHRGPITVDLAVQWALSSGPGDPARAERRLWAVRQFARHRAAFDSSTEVPPAGLLGRIPRRKQPHIYSDAEISALLRECRRLSPRGGLRPTTYVTFFSLLASTGLRLSEARRLERRDVDLSHGLLTIRMSKFRKSRLVPLHPTSVQALTGYAARRDAFPDVPRSEFFFRTDRAPALKRAAIEKTFSRVRNRLGWTAHGRARRPRIHDLRHTFAVRRLLRWYAEGAEVDRKILALATCLGHAKVTDTYWYLSAVPELMAFTSQRFEQFAQRERGPAS
jgi:integrase